MHRKVLKVMSIRQYKISVELHTSLLESTKYANYLLAWE